jgi:hypothetical protein
MNRLLGMVVSRERGAALLIVLAFVVLLTGVGVAYLSRTTSDRQVAHSSFNQSNVDQLIQSAVDNIIGDLRQEIADGSTAIIQADGSAIYMPTAAANMIPRQSGDSAIAPNLIRRSIRSDPIQQPPGRASRASAVNSTTDASANGRSISLARWNTHYLLPKYNTLNDDSYPPSPLLPPFNPYPAVPSGFTPPDWVFATNEYGAAELLSPNRDSSGRPVTVTGRYAYAIYDESGLLDMNVAGYPTGTAVTQSGRKGSIAFADLRHLCPTGDCNAQDWGIPNPNSPNPGEPPLYQVDRIVGWRNYATAQPTNNFPDAGTIGNPGTAFAYNFRTGTGPAGLFYNYVLNNTNGFLSPSASTWNGRTDQIFVQRQELLAFRKTTGFSQNALQYLGTFSRETNAPSFSPSTPPGSTIDYAGLASTPDAINPNFLLRRVTSEFIRFDGTRAVVGEPLVKTRFPLRRLAWITYRGPSVLRTLPPQTPALPPTDPNYDMWALQWLYGIPPGYLQAGTTQNIKKCFGLTFPPGGTPGSPWTYTNPNGSAAVGRIMRLDEVAGARRDPDFFELLQAGILSGSLGQNTAGGVTGGNVFPDIHMGNSSHHILSIGAAIIDQADPDSIPTRIQLNPTGTAWTAYGVESLPYITELYPIAGTSPNDPTKWATYLLFQLWNPHQNAGASTPSVRLRVDGVIGIFTGGNGQTWTPGGVQLTATGQSVKLNPAFSFSVPTPLTNVDTTNAAAPPGPAGGGAFAVLAAPPVP